MLGWFPGPAVYGFAVQLHGKSDSGWGMGALMLATIFMPIFITLALIFDKNYQWKNMFKRLSNEEVIEAPCIN